MKTKLLILATLLFAPFTFAQNAQSILDKASSTFDKAGGVSLSFTLEQKEGKSTYNQDGTALIKGNKFKIDVPDGITWFDGKTQWVYIKGSDEVNVTNPTGEELAAISPTVLLNLYKSGFNLSYKGEVKDQGKAVYKVEMVPQSKKSDISKFVIHVNKQNSQISSIVIVNKNKTQTSIKIKQYKTGVSLSDSTFTFNKKDYPKVEIIDLR